MFGLTLISNKQSFLFSIFCLKINNLLHINNEKTRMAKY